MIRRTAAALALAVLGALVFAVPAGASGQPCAKPSKVQCVAVESLEDEFSKAKAEAHSDNTFKAHSDNTFNSTNYNVNFKIIIIALALALAPLAIAQGALGGFTLVVFFSFAWWRYSKHNRGVHR